MSERAREAAARALNALWCPTCEPYEHTDDAHRAYCAKSANAAIDGFLGALSETHVVVPRGLLEQVVFDGLRATDRYGLHDVCVSCGERPPKHENGCELAAIAATLNPEAGQ